MKSFVAGMLAGLVIVLGGVGLTSCGKDQRAGAESHFGARHLGGVGTSSDVYVFYADDTKCVYVDGGNNSPALSCDWGH